jgi:hypothetical protein
VTTQIISQGQCLLGEAEPAMREALSSGLVQQNTGTIPANLTVTAAGRALLARAKAHRLEFRPEFPAGQERNNHGSQDQAGQRGQ